MAYYYTRAAMAMVDISLLYTGLTVHAGVPIANSSVSVWIDSELAVRPRGAPFCTRSLKCFHFLHDVTGATDWLRSEFGVH